MLGLLAEKTLEQLPSELTVLSALVAPAVLILGSSSLIAATSTRLGRMLERGRRLAEQIETLLENPARHSSSAEKFELLVYQLQRTSRRTRLLQRAMTALYAALGAFVATSIALGIDAAVRSGGPPLLAIVGLLGAGLLFYASVLLVAESRVAIAAVNREMEFIGRLANSSGKSIDRPTEKSDLNPGDKV
jgi:hypothetical protein